MSKTPFVSMGAGGKIIDLLTDWEGIFISCTITDESGKEADKIVIEVDDNDGRVEYPNVGDEISITAGYREGGGVLVGKYEVNKIDLEGWPQQITINGTSVSALKKNKERKTEAYKEDEHKTLGDIMQKIAQRNGWTLKMHEELKKIKNDYEAQAEESDQAFATRLMARYDALVAVKQGNMIVTKRAEGDSASGQALPQLIVRRGGNLLSYSVSWTSKPDSKKVKAHYFDRDKVKKEEVESEGGEGSNPASADAEADHIIRKPFKNKEEAQKAADAKAAEIARQEGSATFEIEGDASAVAERPILVQGVRRGVDGIWNPTTVTHTINSGGYMTTFDCETPGKGDKKGKDK